MLYEVLSSYEIRSVPGFFEIMATFHVREATQNDVPGMAKVRVDTWRAAYKGIIPDDFLEGLSYQRVAERWKDTFWENRNSAIAIFVAENKPGEIVGIAIMPLP